MNDYYLRTETEEEMLAAFSAIGIPLPAGGNLDGRVVYVNGVRMDIGWIGPVVRPNPSDPEGQPIVNSRYHVNMRVSGELPASVLDALPILNPSPSNPMRVWG